jgi:type II secretory pathway component PulF
MATSEALVPGGPTRVVWWRVAHWAAVCLSLFAILELIFVVPKFLHLYEELGVIRFAEPTGAVAAVSHWVTANWWLVALVGVLLWLVGTRRRWRATSRTAAVALLLAALLFVFCVFCLFAAMLPLSSVVTELSQ